MKNLSFRILSIDTTSLEVKVDWGDIITDINVPPEMIFGETAVESQLLTFIEKQRPAPITPNVISTSLSDLLTRHKTIVSEKIMTDGNTSLPIGQEEIENLFFGSSDADQVNYEEF
jgi:hypothetical protein